MKWKGKINFETRAQVNGDRVFTEGEGEVNLLTSKTTPASSDLLLLEDSADSYAKKKVTIDSVKGVSVQDEGSPVTDTPHNTLDFIGDGVDATNAGGGVVVIEIPGTVFGTERGYNSSETASSTTSATPQQKVRLSKTSLPSGTYHIEYSAEYVRLDDKNSESNVRIQINDTTTIGYHYDEDSKGGAGLYHMVSGMYEAALSGNINIDLDYYDTGGGTTGIQRARLSIWRVE
jgi:hypothetical protein